MGLADYAHWNEDARYMWWQEEGRHVEEPEYDEEAYLPGYEDDDEDPEEIYLDDSYDELGLISDDYEDPFPALSPQADADDARQMYEDAHLEQAYEDSQLGYFREDY